MSASSSLNPPLARISFAQNMEDILLDRVFSDQRTGAYFDVGACHPVLDSNTHFFHLRGWRGVNLEPNPEGIQRFREQRPDDLNLAVAASDRNGSCVFYKVQDHSIQGLSTCDPEMAQRYRAQGVEVFEHSVPIRTLRSIVQEHQIAEPDFLSIDVELQEEDVIRGIDLKHWQPRVIVVEATIPATSTPCHHLWEPILLEHGYIFAYFNGLNRFYLREDMADRLECFEVPVNVFDQFRRYNEVLLEELLAEAHGHLARLEETLRARETREEMARRQQGELHALVERIALEMYSHAAALSSTNQMNEELSRERDDLRRLLESQHERLTQALVELRPYQLIDRIGLVTACHGLARRLKRRLAS